MQWFKDIRLAVKLTSAFVVLALVVGVVGMLGRSATNALSDQVSFLKENIIAAMVDLGTAEVQMNAYRGSTWKAMAVSDAQEREKAWKEAEESARAVEEAFGRYAPTATFPGEKEGVDTFRETWPKVIAARQQAMAARGKSVVEAERIMEQDVRPLDRKVRELLRTLMELNIREANERSQASLDDAASKGQQILIWGSVAAIAAILLGMLLSRHITNPLVQVTHAAERIADGDLDVKVEVSQKDEIGQLADAQRKMVQRLRTIILEIQAVAEHVASGSEQMTASSDELSQGATRQSRCRGRGIGIGRRNERKHRSERRQRSSD